MNAHRCATTRAERRHVRRLERAWELREERKVRGHRRVTGWQRARRDGERRVRASALAYRRWAMRQGVMPEEVAARLGMSPRTLSRWAGRWRVERLGAAARGRRMRRADLETRRLILGVLAYVGPGVSIVLLREFFPEVARRELEDLRRRYRRAYRMRRSLLVHVLHWKRAGAVWAMDFKKPPLPVDGLYPKVMATRDLGSSDQLLGLPALDETGQTVRDALEALFKEHGPPLVIKSDQGSAFVAEETREFLQGHGVQLLLSPPRLPSYNGACEAGIGSMATRAHHASARNGRPGEWTCDDLELARLEANETARPWGMNGPTPEEVWQGRTPITEEERALFARTVVTMREEARRRREKAAIIELARHREDAIEREAISRALVACGILKLRRRRIPPPIKLVSRAIIS